MERTFVMLKPDAVKRGLIGDVINRIERKGLRIVKIKSMVMSEDLIKEHYAAIQHKPFFPEILEFMQSDYVVPMIIEGENAIKKIKMLVGPTQWYDALPGTIRGDYDQSTTENIVHCTDPEEENPQELAEIEIKRFFGDNA